MKKSLIALFIAFVMVFSMAGCGRDSGDNYSYEDDSYEDDSYIASDLVYEMSGYWNRFGDLEGDLLYIDIGDCLRKAVAFIKEGTEGLF